VRLDRRTDGDRPPKMGDRRHGVAILLGADAIGVHPQVSLGGFGRLGHHVGRNAFVVNVSPARGALRSRLLPETQLGLHGFNVSHFWPTRFCISER